jgi:hypothetical protein
MVKVLFMGGLVSLFGRERLVKANSVIQALSEIDRNGVIVREGKVRAGVIVLVNGLDWRLEKGPLSEEAVITVIPVNHGG